MYLLNKPFDTQYNYLHYNNLLCGLLQVFARIEIGVKTFILKHLFYNNCFLRCWMI